MKSDNFIVLRTFSSELDAEVALSHLAREGIQACISKDDAGGMYPVYQHIHGVRLLVMDTDKEHADDVLKAMGI